MGDMLIPNGAKAHFFKAIFSESIIQFLRSVATAENKFSDCFHNLCVRFSERFIPILDRTLFFQIHFHILICYIP